MADQTVKSYFACGSRVAIARIETPPSKDGADTAVSFTLSIDAVVKPFGTAEVKALVEALDRALQGR